MESTTGAWLTAIPGNNITSADIAEGVLLSAAYITEAALGLAVNTILICAIILGSHTSKQVHIQLINLAIADMLFGTFVCTKAILAQNLIPLSKLPWSDFSCKFVVYMYSSSYHICSLWGMTISIERLYIIYFPLKLRNYTRSRKLIIAALVWISCSLIGIYGALYTVVIENKFYTFGGDLIVQEVCVELSYHPDKLCYTTICSLLPVMLMILMYILIACKLCGRRQIGETEQPRKSKQNCQIIIMLAADAFFNLLTTLPVHLFLVYEVISYLHGIGDPDTALVAMKVIYAIALMNSFITPVFYYIFNQSIRKDVRNLWKNTCAPLYKRKKKLATDVGDKLFTEGTHISGNSSSHKLMSQTSAQ